MPPLPPEDLARQRLDALAGDLALTPREAYFALSLIWRRYLNGRFGLEALEMTCEELLPRVADLPLEAGLIQASRQFAGDADLVKFGASQASPDRLHRDLGFVRRFVDATTAAAPETATPGR
jgi:hypothetical protein